MLADFKIKPDGSFSVTVNGVTSIMSAEDFLKTYPVEAAAHAKTIELWREEEKARFFGAPTST